MRFEHWLYMLPLKRHSIARPEDVEQDLDDEIAIPIWNSRWRPLSVLGDVVAAPTATASLLVTMAGLALALGTVGAHGVLSLLISRRTVVLRNQ